MHPLESFVSDSLVNQVSPEFLSVLIEGLAALREHMYTEHELPVMNACSREQEVLSIEEVNDTIFKALVDVCRMHRVTVDTSSATMTNLAKFVRALLLMQFWEDGNSILALCESDASDEEKLCAIVNLVGELTELTAQDIVMEVDPNLIRGLTRMYTTGDISTEEIVHEIPDDQLARLRQWRDLMKAQKTLAFRMVKSGYKPGFAYEEYIKRVVGTLSQMDNNAVAVELVPFLLLGRDTWTNPLKGWRDNTSLLNIAPNDITAVDVAVVKLLGEFDRLSTNSAAV